MLTKAPSKYLRHSGLSMQVNIDTGVQFMDLFSSFETLRDDIKGLRLRRKICRVLEQNLTSVKRQVNENPGVGSSSTRSLL